MLPTGTRIFWKITFHRNFARMATFGWKKKIGAKVSKSAAQAFEAESKDDEDEALTSGEVDWLCLAPQKNTLVLEDARLKSERLQQEGATLAEAERFWEALMKLDQALQLTPLDEKIYEMKAQAYLMLNELYPAAQAAEKAVSLNPLWWVGHQTLGRTKLGLGEVRMAVKSFSRALHLNPADQELWEQDLGWARSLLERKRQVEQAAIEEAERAEAESSCQITELDCGSGDEDSDSGSPEKSVDTEDGERRLAASGENTDIKCDNKKRKLDKMEPHSEQAATSSANTGVKVGKFRKKIPSSYVFMRD